MQRFVPDFRIDARNLLRVLPLAMSLISLTLAAPAMAQEQPPRTLTVTGRGVESIPTTLTKVQLGVEVQGKTAAEVQEEVARRSSAVVELLKSRNVEKLETTGITLNPVYSYEGNVQRLTGYAGTNTVSFRLDTPSAGSLLDEAVKAGATRIDGISFVAADSAIAVAQKQALREAVEEANQQADAVLSALNFTRREVIGIRINDAAPPQIPIINYAVMAERADKAASTPVIGGEQQVEASVTLQIRY
ncbi:SIMPL domain-containing protein [Microcoleus sp. FACHB-68]|nr:SIMPL domain-containing protein [Microcoleus sp. FACHB-68]